MYTPSNPISATSLAISGEIAPGKRWMVPDVSATRNAARLAVADGGGE